MSKKQSKNLNKTNNQTNKVKNLTFKDIKKIDKSLDQWKEITLVDKNTEQEYKVEVNQYVRESVITELIKEMIRGLEYFNNNKSKFEYDSDHEFLLTYSVSLILKYFTTLNKDFPNKIEERIYLIKILTDNGFLESILKEIPEEYMRKITEKTELMNDYVNENQEEFVGQMATGERVEPNTLQKLKEEYLTELNDETEHDDKDNKDNQDDKIVDNKVIDIDKDKLN